MKSKRIRVYKKTPKEKGRASFDITIDIVEVDDSKTYRSLNKELKKTRSVLKEFAQRLKSVNESYKKGSHSFNEAAIEVEKIKVDVKRFLEDKEPKRTFNQKNLELVEEYMVFKYRRRKTTKDAKKSMRYDLLRSVKTLEGLSLRTASEEQIQDCLERNKKNRKQQIRMVSRLSQLLKYIGRGEVELIPDDEPLHKVKYLKQFDEDFMLLDVLKKNHGEVLSTAAAIANFCMLRQGEVFGIEEHWVRNKNLLYVESQLTPEGERRKPKNKKPRMTPIPNEGYEAILRWIQFTSQQKDALRKQKNTLPNAIKNACKELWPHNLEKHLNFHDLRHNGAVFLASSGHSCGSIAKSMGNSEAVCKKHYQSFLVTDKESDAMISTYKGAKRVKN